MKRAVAAALLALVVATACIPNPYPRLTAWLAATATKADANFVHEVIPGTALNAWPKTHGNPDCRAIAEPVVPGSPRYTAPFTAVSFMASVRPDLWMLLCHPPGRGLGPSAYAAPTLKITKDPNTSNMRPVMECVIVVPPKVGSPRGLCEYVGRSRFQSSNVTVWRYYAYVQVV